MALVFVEASNRPCGAGDERVSGRRRRQGRASASGRAQRRPTAAAGRSRSAIARPRTAPQPLAVEGAQPPLEQSQQRRRRTPADPREQLVGREAAHGAVDDGRQPVAERPGEEPRRRAAARERAARRTAATRRAYSRAAAPGRPSFSSRIARAAASSSTRASAPPSAVAVLIEPKLNSETSASGSPGRVRAAEALRAVLDQQHAGPGERREVDAAAEEVRDKDHPRARAERALEGVGVAARACPGRRRSERRAVRAPRRSEPCRGA